MSNSMIKAFHQLFNPDIMPRYVKLDQGISENAIEDDDGVKNVLRFRDWSGFTSYSNEDYVEEEPSIFSPESRMYSFLLGSILLLLGATLIIIAVIVTLKMIRYFEWRRKLNEKKRANLGKIIHGSSRQHSSDLSKTDLYCIWNERFREDRLYF